MVHILAALYCKLNQYHVASRRALGLFCVHLRRLSHPSGGHNRIPVRRTIDDMTPVGLVPDATFCPMLLGRLFTHILAST